MNIGFFLNVYLFLLRERESVEKVQRERRERIPSRLCAVSTEPYAGAQTHGTVRS